VTGLVCKGGKCLDRCTADPASCLMPDAGGFDGSLGDDGGGGGDTGASDATFAPPAASPSSGCGCAIPAESGSALAGLGGLSALALVVGARRRVRRRVPWRR
jgi:MYXO-CTERM domain-containing protein